MAIEIRQLVIRAVVEDKQRQRPAPAAAAAVERARAPALHAPTAPAIDRADLVSQCTRQVLRELRKRRER